MSLKTNYKALVIGGILLCLSAGLTLFYQSGYPQRTIKQIVEYQLSQVFRWDVSIEKIEGNLFNAISAKNVRFSNHPLFPGNTVLDINEVSISYSIWKAILKGGDFAAATSIIEGKNIRLRILRDKRDLWNVLQLIPPPPPPSPLGLPPPPPTFKGKFKLTNMLIDFEDELGWSKERPLDKSFTDRFFFSSAYIDYDQLDRVQLHMKGHIVSSKQPFIVRGHMSAYDGRYDLMFSTRPHLDKWAPYVFPFPQFPVSNDFATIQGRIISKFPFPQREIPFWYDIHVLTEKADIGFPFFPMPARNVKAEMELVQGYLPKNAFNEIAKNIQGMTSEDIWIHLNNAGYLNKNGRITVRIVDGYKLKNIPSALKKVEEKIIDILQDPPSYAMINHMTGSVNQIPLLGSGLIEMNRNKLNISLASTEFPVENIKDVFPGISKWRIHGDAKTHLAVYGELQRPQVDGVMILPKGKFYAFKPEHTRLSYRYADRRLGFSIDHADLYDGVVTGKGELDINTRPSKIRAAFEAKNLDSHRIFPNSKQIITGNMTIIADLNGEVDDYHLFAELQSKNLNIIGQKVSTSHVTSRVIGNSDIDILNTEFFINTSDTPIFIEGTVKNLRDAELEFSGIDIPFRDIDRSNKENQMGLAQIEGTFLAELVPNFWVNPEDESWTTLVFTAKNLPLFHSHYDEVTLNMIYDKKDVFIDTFSAKNNDFDSYIAFRGSFNQLFPTDLSIDVRHVNITNSEIIGNQLPSIVRPFGGVLTSKVHIKSIPGDFNKKNATVKGELLLEDGYIQNQPFEKLTSKLNWKNGELTITDATFHQNDSRVIANGTVDSDYQFNIDIENGTSLDLNDFRIFTAPIGSIKGVVNVEGNVSGNQLSPMIDMNFTGEALQSNFVRVKKVGGNVRYRDRKLHINDVRLSQQNSYYRLDGYIDLDTLQYGDTWEDMVYEFNINVDDASVAELTKTVEGVINEIRFRLTKDVSLWEEIRNANVKVEPKRSFQIVNPYISSTNNTLFQIGNNRTSISFFNTIQDEQEVLIAENKFKLTQEVSGTIKGKISAFSRLKKPPKVDATLNVDDFEFSIVKAANVSISMKSDQDSLGYGLALNNVIMGGQSFSKVSSIGAFDDTGMLNIFKTEIKTKKGNVNNILKGYFPVRAYWNSSAERDMHLELNLNKNEISLIAVASPFLEYITNEGRINLVMSGDINEPKIKSNAFILKNAKFKLKSKTLVTPFRITDEKITFQNNWIAFPNMKVEWERNDSSGKYNTFVVNGNMGIKNINLLNPENVIFDFDLKIKEGTNYRLNIPNMYRGKLSMSDVFIRGPLLIPISKNEKERIRLAKGSASEIGPEIKGNFHFYNGEVILASTPKSGELPSVKLDVGIDIGKEMGVVGGFFGEGILAGFANSVDLQMRPTATPLRITGSLNSPRIENQIFFDEGFITVVNRNFDLINTFKQEIYYDDRKYRIHENTISFETEELDNGRSKLYPNLNVTALSIVEQINNTSTENAIADDITYKAALVTIKGPINNIETITFEGYELDRLNPTLGEVRFEREYVLSNADAVAGNVNTVEILRILVPELGDEGVADANNIDQGQRLLSVVGESQINSIVRRRFLRPVERKIAKEVGLYDVRVDYNVGRAIVRGASDDNFAENETVGVDIVQRLFSDKLFLRVRTDLDLRAENTESDDGVQLSEVELRYYFLRNLSATFANIRDRSDQTIHPIFSLRYSYEF